MSESDGLTTVAHSAEARRILDESIVIDTVNRSVIDDELFADAKVGGITVLGRTILYSEPAVQSRFGFDESLRLIVGDVISQADDRSQQMIHVKSVDDINEAHQTGKVGVYVYFQSPEPIGLRMDRLRLFYELGLRVLQLTYNSRGYLGDGCGERQNSGLSDFGVDVVKECNRLGISIDVSHCSSQTRMDAVAVSSAPVLATHANARALCDNPRNLSDEEATAIASSGGVVGAVPLAGFVSEEPNPTYDQFIDHIDYLVELIGVDHVGIGLDLFTGQANEDPAVWSKYRNEPGVNYKDEIYGNVRREGALHRAGGMSRISDTFFLVERMVDRGYEEGALKKILGENFIRAFTETWK